MLVRVLGTTEVVRGDGPVDLGGRKQRTLLAALALAGPRAVAVDTLVDQVWGDEAPATAVPTLHVYLAGLRRALEPERPPRSPAKVIVTVAPGYALRSPTDAARFDAAVDAVHRRLGTWSGPAALPRRPELSAGDVAEAAGRLDEALASWRGTPFLDLADAPAAVAERSRLDELRLVALEDRAVLGLARGEHATVAAELEALTAEHPLRERLWQLRILALAGSGRQADALDAVRRVRQVLADELGLDPGTALRDLEGAVLRQDPVLDWHRRPAPAPQTHGAAPAPAAPATPSQAALGDPLDWPLAGRTAEMAALDALFAPVAAGAPRFAVLVGEPGIGKTRLTREVAGRARGRGFAVLTGRCSEDEGAPPLWPWVGVLRELVDQVPPAELPEAAREHLAACGTLLTPGSGAAPPGPGEAEAARFRLWHAVTGLLVAASAVRPLLVVLDDLHWADPSSLRLLTHLADVADTGRLLVVATRRPHPEPAGALARLAERLSRRHALRLDLAGLSTAEAAALVETATSRTPARGEAEALRDRTDGNPFFLVELVRLGGAELPAAVQDVVARRVARLPDATADLLRTAAVAGRRFDLAVLAAAAGRGEDAVLDDLDPALAAGVIAEEETVDRFRFAHALVRDVVYAGLPAARRARRHAAVAGVLAGDSGLPRSEIARHWLAAGPAHAARAWRAAADAAEQARGLYAHEEAATLLAAAVDAQRGDGTATPLERYDLLMAHADACRWLADRVGLDRALAGAVAEARRLGDVVRVARAAVGAAEGALWQLRPYGVVDGQIVAGLREVLAELPAGDSELRCRVLLGLAGELYYADATAYREALAEQGLAMARRLGDPALLVWAAQIACLAIWRPGNAQLRLDLAGEALAAALALRDPMWEAVARTLRASVCGELGRIADLRAEASRAREIADRLRLVYVQLVLGEMEAPWLAMRGRFADAERLAAQRHELAAAVSAPQHQAADAVIDLYVPLWQGRAADLAPAFRHLAAAGSFPMEVNLQWSLARGGLVAEARAEYAATGLPAERDDWLSVMHYCQRAELAFAAGLPEVAGSAYRALAPYAGRCCTAGFGAALGPVDAFLALAAAASGERRIAAGHAEDALRLCTEWDIPLAARWLRSLSVAEGGPLAALERPAPEHPPHDLHGPAGHRVADPAEVGLREAVQRPGRDEG